MESGGAGVVAREVVAALRLGRNPGAGLDSEGRELVGSVADARREYQQALNYFNCVSEPGLVEHAVLRLAAAERRYTYLLGQARSAGIRLPWTISREV